jgi:hypothetical protein
MKNRCYDPNFIQFHDYGGRGITICEQWRGDFNQFLRDMGECPAGHSLERVNRDGDYEPGNCKWATAVEQGRNKRNNRFLTFNGVTKAASAWAEEYGLNPRLVYSRLAKGWPVEKVLTTPAKGGKKE